VSARHPLALDDLRIRHDAARAWTPDGVSFTVAPGEVVLLLGPSGSGKSTLALALNGLIPHAVPATVRGRVLVDGVDTTKRTVAELSQHVSMVFQDPDAQIVTGTVLDEVCFGPENLLVPKDEVLLRAERSLRTVGLWERRSENPDRLSGGGRQRLAIACALAMESPVIVLDEPTANLDPVGIEEVYAALAEVVAGGERSIVLVEHNLDAAIELVDRVVVLDRDGRLVTTGTVDAVLRLGSDSLVELGVWLPVATLAALRLRAAGIEFEPLPLTPHELTAALDRVELPAAPTPPAPAPTAAPLVTVRDLTVTRPGPHRTKRVVLDAIDLEVGEGDFLAIVGANGAGKTTLLQAIAGVVAPPKGRISTAGLDPATADVRSLAGRLGFVFQNPEQQFIRYTVAEELGHALEIRGLPAEQIANRVDGMLERFGLTALRELHPFLLSGGQKRRLSVGTALIAGAPVLALDEPTFGQDRERAAELLDLLAQLNGEGTTVIVVTHDMQLVADYASHVAVLGGGRLLASGTTREVLSGDTLEAAGLRHPPLASAMRALSRHPGWRTLSRLSDLPGGEG
jgi:energy-coupling factor transport system ATP-binding protein